MHLLAYRTCRTYRTYWAQYIWVAAIGLGGLLGVGMVRTKHYHMYREDDKLLHGTYMAPIWHLYGTYMAPIWRLYGTLCIAAPEDGYSLVAG